MILNYIKTNNKNNTLGWLRRWHGDAMRLIRRPREAGMEYRILRWNRIGQGGPTENSATNGSGIPHPRMLTLILSTKIRDTRDVFHFVITNCRL